MCTLTATTASIAEPPAESTAAPAAQASRMPARYFASRGSDMLFMDPAPPCTMRVGIIGPI